MMKLFTTIITIILIFSYTLFPGTTGRIEGKVLDEEGQPAIGANVRIEGTTKGAKTKFDGSYLIANIETGKWKVTVSYTGKATQTKEVNISADRIIKLDFKLSVSENILEDVIVYGTKMLPEDKIGQVASFQPAEIKGLVISNVNSIVALTAGVQESGSGFNIRNSRNNQTVMKLDGMEVSDPFDGGYGTIGNRYFPSVSQLALSEVQVKTGGFGAEDGGATGGIVNMTINTGNATKYQGSFQYRTDVGVLFGSAATDIEILNSGNNLEVRNFGDGAQLQGRNEHQMDFTLNGPIPGLGKSTFSLSNRTIIEEFAGASYKVLDPLGNNLGRLPDNNTMVRNTTARFSFQINDDIKLLTGGTYGLSNIKNSAWSWLYANDPARFITYDNFSNPIDTTIVNVPERVYKQGGTEWGTLNAFARINHSITASTYYQIGITFNQQHDYSGRLKDNGTPGYFTGWEFHEPEDNYNFSNGAYFLKDRIPQLYNQKNQVSDLYDINEIVGKPAADGKGQPTSIVVENPISGYHETAQNATRSLDNAYGVYNSFIKHSTGGYSFRNNNYLQIDGNIESSFKTEKFDHFLKAGFEFRTNTLDRISVPDGTNQSGIFVNDQYTEKYDLVYADSDTTYYYKLGTQAQRPWTFNVFVQDQIKYKDLVFTPGFRLDYLNPNQKYRTLPASDAAFGFTSIEQYETAGFFEDSEGRALISPRLNILYPVSASTQVSLNYGVYYKFAPFTNLYDNFNAIFARNNARIGNPNMKPEKTNMYEINFNQGLGDDFVFTINAYYKDVFNEVGVVAIRTLPEPYFQVDVVDYGTYRGAEFEIRKRDADNYGFRINYTLAQALGTSDNVNTNLGVQPDRSIPGVDIFPFPLAPYPLARDIRHSVNTTFRLFFNDSEGPSLGGIKFLENTLFGLTYDWRSGLPYTISDLAGNALSERNAERLPSVWRVDLNITKTLNLDDFFGDSFKGIDIQFSLQVQNVLNNNAAVSYFNTSSDPDYNAARFQSFRIGQIQNINYYKDYLDNITESQGALQYDIFGNRLYNENSDFDKNGIITQQEMYQAYVNRFTTEAKFKPNYQTPRTVFFGFTVTF